MEKLQRWLGVIDYCMLGFSIFVVGLGAYTRLSDSGLGCPDWPACYGHWRVYPTIATPSLSYDQSQKAFVEMFHRYMAGMLGVGLILLSIRHLILKKTKAWQALVLIPLIGLQAAFGMFTVTWKLHPFAVMPHLIGGMLITCLWFTLIYKPHFETQFQPHRNASVLLSMLFGCLWIQIILGGWTSANYAATICPSFPYCTLTHWSFSKLRQFDFFAWLPIGPSYETGGYSAEVRMAIHMLHRGGALVITMITFGLLNHLRVTPKSRLRQSILLTIGLITMQMILGILNVLWQLPIIIAVCHNLFALFSLLSCTCCLIQVQFASHTYASKTKPFSQHANIGFMA